MKLFAKKLLMFLPLLLFVIGCNYYIDPGKLFQQGYEKGIAKILLNGKNVENLVNYDERLVQKHYINNLKKAKEIIIIGSSRSMLINSDILRNKSTFNSSVSGASLEDYMAIYEMYRQKDILPKKIIIGIDPWVFNKNNGQSRWKSISNYYYSLEDILGYENINKKSIEYKKYSQLYSLEYFQSSVDFLFKDRIEYFSTNKKKSFYNIKLSDGSLVYPKSIREAEIEEVELEAKKYIITNPIYSLDDYDEMDKKYIDKFNKFINLIKSDGVKVYIYLPPYYPNVYDFLINSDKYKIIIEIEKYINDFALINDLQVFGSYNPENDKQKYKLTKEYFYDGMHSKTEAMEAIFNNFPTFLAN